MPPRLLSTSSAPCIFCRAALNTHSKTASRQLVAHGSTVRNQNRKNSKTDYAVIQLLKHVPTYGEKGAYMRVPRGAMRNQFYPRAQARYVLGDELKELKERDDIKIERDRSFLSPALLQKQERAARDAAIAAAEEMRLEMVRSEEQRIRQHEEEVRRQEEQEAEQQRMAELVGKALARLPNVVEPNYMFYRPANTASAQLDKTGNWKAGTPIFGSITLTDILGRLRNSLSKDVDTEALPIDESDVSIVSGVDKAEPDRIKALGVFGIELSIRGTTEVITTTVQVLPDESSDEALAQAREAAKEAARIAARPVMPKESAASAFAKGRKQSP